MAKKSTAKKWKPAQIRKHIKEIEKVIKKHKRLVKKGQDFTSVAPEDIKRKLGRQNSPMIVSQSWSGTTAGGTFTYRVGLYNPDPTQAIWLFAHVWVGSGNVDPVVGSFLQNIDTRFPRLTKPSFAGLTIPAGGSTVVNFKIKVPSGVEKTDYLGNCCLMRFNWHDVGTYLDRAVFVFNVS